MTPRAVGWVVQAAPWIRAHPSRLPLMPSPLEAPLGGHAGRRPPIQSFASTSGRTSPPTRAGGAVGIHRAPDGLRTFMDGAPSNGNAGTAPAIAVRDGHAVPAWAVLALVCLGQFMVVLDVSIVNVALPSIQRDLGFSSTGLQWVVNAYTLTFAGFLLLGGRAADLFGRRRMFLAGLGMFTVASVVGGFAQSQAMLIGARAVQGIGGAIISTATMAIIATS